MASSNEDPSRPAFNLILGADIIKRSSPAIAGDGIRPDRTLGRLDRFTDPMGSNPSVFALGSVFNALKLGRITS